MSAYFEQKKRNGLIFTLHNINPTLPYVSMKPEMTSEKPVDMPKGPLFWSRLSGRYRTYEEQREFLREGCVDRKLPKLEPYVVEVSETNEQISKMAS